METEFEKDLNRLVNACEGVSNSSEVSQIHLKRNKIGNALESLKYVRDNLQYIQEFLKKYDEFLVSIDKTHGTTFNQSSNSIKKFITDLIPEIRTICVFISKGNIDHAIPMLDGLFQKSKILENELEKIVVLPHIIDLSELDYVTKKKIGIAGVHYRSRIFLSYPFRDTDPTKDENQQFIDYLIKPLLHLFNIEPITARSHLVSNEDIEDKTIALITDCDGIIGFFTTGDSIENIEHELANNENIIAVCKEKGANSPSMRRSKLQIEFMRVDPSQLLLDIAKALKSKEMFKLVV